MATFFVCKELNDATLSIALKKKCSRIIYIQSSSKIKPLSQIQFINANNFDRPSYEQTFNSNKQNLLILKKIDSHFFQYKGISLLEAINKDLFWSTRYEGMLKYAVETSATKQDEIIYYSERFATLKKGIKKILIGIQFFRGYFSSAKQYLNKNQIARPYAFYVADDFEVNYFENLTKEFGLNSCAFFFNHSLAEIEPSFKSTFSKTVFFSGNRVQETPFNKFSLTILLQALKVFNVKEFLLILKIRNNLIKLIDINLSNLSTSIKAVFLVAQENTGFGNITAQICKQKGILTVNSHNGIKSSDVYNRDNHFDIWCCWNEGMKQMLNKECFINESQLIITGHLMEDVARKHFYHNTFQGFHDSSKSGIVISLFSTKENPPGKWQLVDSLLEFITKQIDAKLIVRLHPYEDIKEWKKYISISPRMRIDSPNNITDKNDLYDQLMISNLTITFGSTIALEGTWFNVPSIVFDVNERSLLRVVDDVMIFHERTVDALFLRMRQLLERKKQLVEEKPCVAKKIKELVQMRIAK